MEIGYGVDIRVVPGNVHHHGLHGSELEQTGQTMIAAKIAGKVPDRTVQQDGMTGDTRVVLIARTYHPGTARYIGGDQPLDHVDLHQRLIPQEDECGPVLPRGDFLERTQSESKGVG
jgi:hypothetical protein